MVTVYLITNRVTGKYYVGQTSKSLRKRLGDHVRAARIGGGCPRLRNSIKRHGEDRFIIEELCSVPEDQADNVEKLWVVSLDATNPIVGYNLSLGGKTLRGYRWSEESKKKNREAIHRDLPRLSKLRERMLGNTFGYLAKGTKWSEESKAKHSVAMLGNTHGTGQPANSGSFQKGHSVNNGRVPWNKGKRRASWEVFFQG